MNVIYQSTVMDAMDAALTAAAASGATVERFELTVTEATQLRQAASTIPPKALEVGGGTPHVGDSFTYIGVPVLVVGTP